MWISLTFKSYWWYSAHSSPYISHDTDEENLSTINEELFNLIAVLFLWALHLIYQWYSQGEFRCQFKGLKLTILLNSWVCGYSHVAGYLSKSIKPHPKELCEGLTPILPSMVLWRPLYDVKVVLEVTCNKRPLSNKLLPHYNIRELLINMGLGVMFRRFHGSVYSSGKFNAFAHKNRSSGRCMSALKVWDMTKEN